MLDNTGKVACNVIISKATKLVVDKKMSNENLYKLCTIQEEQEFRLDVSNCIFREKNVKNLNV